METSFDMRWDCRKACVVTASAHARRSGRFRLRRCKGDGPADDGGGRERAEVATIETVGDVDVHEEQLVRLDAAAAVPDRQGAAATVAVARFAERHIIDGDGVAGATHPLPRAPHDALQERHVAADIAALDHEIFERLGRHHRDQVGNFETLGRIDPIEPDRRAGRHVPDEPGRCRNDRCCGNAHRGEVGQHDIAEAGSLLDLPPLEPCLMALLSVERGSWPADYPVRDMAPMVGSDVAGIDAMALDCIDMQDHFLDLRPSSILRRISPPGRTKGSV